jgi:hypothetical protein
MVAVTRVSFTRDLTSFLRLRCGDTFEEDPILSPRYPEILDVEISTICSGPYGIPCSFCYKSNGPEGRNMSLATFTKVIDMIPEIDQVALGIGSIDGNPDLWAIMEYCRFRGVVPNLTTSGAGVTPAVAEKLALLCGAVSVSYYGDVCFEALGNLHKAGLKQHNIHSLLAKETLKGCYHLIDSVSAAKAGVGDQRLIGVNAIVFLLLKPKGKRNTLHSIDNLDEYGKLLNYAMSKGVQVGFDSCSAAHAYQNLSNEHFTSIDACESTLFSLYLSLSNGVDSESNGAYVFPCSFCESTEGWETGIDLLSEDIKDFQDVWYHPRIVAFREKLLKSSTSCNCAHVADGCRSCVIYDVTVCNRKPNLPDSDQLVNIHD